MVDTEIPSGVQMTCTRADGCPRGWRCDLAQRRCVQGSPGVVDDVGVDSDAAEVQEVQEVDDAVDAVPWDVKETPRYADRAAVCGAIHDKIHTCESETRATLGEDVWLLFAAERSDFIDQVCVPGIAGEMSDAELDQFLLQMALLPLAPCDYFVNELCASLAEVMGPLPGC